RAFANETIAVEKTETEVAPSIESAPKKDAASGGATATPSATVATGTVPSPIATDKVWDDSAAKTGAPVTAGGSPVGAPSDPLRLATGGDKTGVSREAISVPQGAGKIQGMGE